MRKKRILILIDTATGWGRSIIRGVAQYSNEVGNWELSLQPRGQVDEMPIPSKWEGDGIIARIASRPMLRKLKSIGLPVVNVSSLEFKDWSFPKVVSDFEKVGQLSAQHLLSAGFRRFGFCATKHSFKNMRTVRESFVEELRRHGSKVDFLQLPNGDFVTDREQDKILEWIHQHDLPMAVLGISVKAPYAVVSACRAGNIHVPEDVSVLSTASVDELVLQIIQPNISCVVTADTTIGFEAARYLDQIMSGRESADKPSSILVPPLRIEVRASSDIMQVSDPLVKKALLFMRENAYRGIQVGEVAAEAGLSRRSLEIRMKRAINRSPAQELRQLKFDLASRLLSSSNLSVPDVATRSGFGTVEHFIVFFKKISGLTPLQYSKKFRDRQRFFH